MEAVVVLVGLEEVQMADGFLGRWSRRKQDQRAGVPLDEPVVAPPANALAAPAAPVVPAAPQALEPEAPPLTLADAQALTLESDFAPFIARGVAPEVKNAALKTLFADPHFNVMDGLDIYIDDYTKPSPLPLSVLRQMVSAKALGLVSDEDEDAVAQPKDPVLPSALEATDRESDLDVAQSGVCNQLPSPPGASVTGAPASQPIDDHADLRLQPDHAPPAPGAGHGTG